MRKITIILNLVVLFAAPFIANGSANEGNVMPSKVTINIPAVTPNLPLDVPAMASVNNPGTAKASAEAFAKLTDEKKSAAAVSDKNNINPVEGPAICDVTVSKYNTVDIHAQNVKISTLLQELALKARKNIILAAGADRYVSLTLYSVPFYDALTVFLDVNGLGYFEENEFINVFTKDQLKERALGKNGKESRFFRLNYMRAEDAESAVKGLLSPSGKIGVIKDEKISNSQGSTKVDDQMEKDDEVYKPNTQDFVFASGITVYDYRDNVEAVATLLAQIDKRPTQVLLEASILMATLNDNDNLGINFSYLSNTSGLQFFDSGTNEGVNPYSLPNGTKGDNLQGGFLSNKAGLNGGFAISNVAMFIQALSSITDTSIVARPKIMTLDRQRAKVQIGNRIGYTENSYSNGQITQSIKFIDDGISLDARTFVMEDGKIRLRAAPKISKVTMQKQVDSKGNEQYVPQEAVQSVVADVMIKPGNSAVIGGLFIDNTESSRQQIPIAGDLPVVGNLAKSRSNTGKRQELIFIITPSVLSDKELDDVATATAADSDNLLTGQRRGLLPFSRQRHSEQLHLRAYRYLANSQNGLGEWTYRRSRQLDNACPPIKGIDTHAPSLSVDGILQKNIREQIGGYRTLPLPADANGREMPELIEY